MKRTVRILLILMAAALCYILAGAGFPLSISQRSAKRQRNGLNRRIFMERRRVRNAPPFFPITWKRSRSASASFPTRKSGIILSTFEFRNDESGKDMMAVFLAAADRGVEVEILMDGFPAFKNLQLTQDPYFQALSSHENIQIALYNPVNLLQPWKLMGRLHDKYLIADSTAYILGGRNTYDYFLGDYGDYKNYDWDVLVYSEEPGQGESMNALLAYFTEVWELPLSRIWKDDPGSRSHGRILRARGGAGRALCFHAEGASGLVCGL